MLGTKSPASQPNLRFEHTQDVRWGDKDVLDHVNNAMYFRYIEEARVQLLLAMGMTLPSDNVAVLAHASLDFLRPLHYPAKIKVILEVLDIGRSSMELSTTVADATESELVYARGRNVLVAVTLKGVVRPWSEHELTSLEKCLVK